MLFIQDVTYVFYTRFTIAVGYVLDFTVSDILTWIHLYTPSNGLETVILPKKPYHDVDKGIT